MDRTSAIRAARTAVTGAQNAGRLDSYLQAEEMGIRLKKRWLSAQDGRTRHAHALLDGQTQDSDEPFHSILGDIMFPGDPNAAPSNVYNCRCTMIAEVKGVDMSAAMQRDRYGVLPDMTFAQWETSKRGTEGAQISSYHRDNRTENVEKPAVEQYNTTIQRLVSVDAASVFETAKSGGRHKGVYNDAVKKKQSTLEKSIASHVAQVEEHADKIAHPERYDTGWAEKDERQREGLLKKWQKDLQRNAEQAEIEIEVWKERFGNDT